MGLTQDFALLIVIVNILFNPATVINRAVHTTGYIQRQLLKRNIVTTYSWEQSWNSDLKNGVTTTTAITAGKLPLNLGIIFSVPSIYNYSYSYGVSSDPTNGTIYTTVTNQSSSREQQREQKYSSSSEISNPVTGVRQKSTNESQSDEKEREEKQSSNIEAVNPADGNRERKHTQSQSKNSTAQKTSSSNSMEQPYIPDTSSSEKQAWLDSHNAYRSMYGVSSLTWDESLVAAARVHATACNWEHTKNNQYGENLAAGQDTPKEAVIAWIEGPNEREIWNPKAPTYTHFTQVVWKATQRVGCYKEECTTITGSNLPQSPVALWTCEYEPRGNVQGQYVENVLAAAGGAPLS